MSSSTNHETESRIGLDGFHQPEVLLLPRFRERVLNQWNMIDDDIASNFPEIDTWIQHSQPSRDGRMRSQHPGASEPTGDSRVLIDISGLLSQYLRDPKNVSPEATLSMVAAMCGSRDHVIEVLSRVAESRSVPDKVLHAALKVRDNLESQNGQELVATTLGLHGLLTAIQNHMPGYFLKTSY